MKIKGAGIKSLLQAVEKLYGAEGLDSVMAQVPSSIRQQIEPAVLAGTMYPVEVSAALQQAIYATIGRRSWAVSYKLGVEATRFDFGSIYRVFLRAVSTETIFVRLERAFSQFNSQGHVRWSDVGTSSASGSVEGVQGFNEGIWRSIAGRVDGVLRLTGARSAMVNISDPQPTRCDFRASWAK